MAGWLFFLVKEIEMGETLVANSCLGSNNIKYRGCVVGIAIFGQFFKYFSAGS